MYIRSASINDIKGIDQLTLTFADPYAGWHVLIGENGSGKSTILRSIALALLPLETLSFFREDWIRWIRKGANISATTGTSFVVLVRDDRFDGIDKATLERNPEIDIKSNRLVGVFNCNPIDEKWAYPSSGGFLKETDAPTFDFWDPLKGWFSMGIGPFRQFSPIPNEQFDSARIRKAAAHQSLFHSSALSDANFWILELDAQRLRDKEYSTVSTSKAGEILDLVRHLVNNTGLFPDSTQFRGVNRQGELEFINASGQSVSIDALSDGFRSVLSLAFELIRRLIECYGSDAITNSAQKVPFQIDLPGIALIDEVDAHLHPSWQVKIGEWFTTYFPKIQFIVTTHSPLICRAAERGSIWKLPALGTGQVEEVTGKAKNALIFGDILDAMGTDLFGTEAAQSTKALHMQEELAQLETTELFRPLKKAEKLRLKELQGKF